MKTFTPGVETILAEAVEIASPDERRAYVTKSCACDPVLQARVERMIADHSQAGSFLERPASPIDADSTGTFAATFIDDKPGTMIGPYAGFLLSPPDRFSSVPTERGGLVKPITALSLLSL
jgi:hypothetical protein